MKNNLNQIKQGAIDTQRKLVLPKIFLQKTKRPIFSRKWLEGTKLKDLQLLGSCGGNSPIWDCSTSSGYWSGYDNSNTYFMSASVSYVDGGYQAIYNTTVGVAYADQPPFYSYGQLCVCWNSGDPCASANLSGETTCTDPTMGYQTILGSPSVSCYDDCHALITLGVLQNFYTQVSYVTVQVCVC